MNPTPRLLLASSLCVVFGLAASVIGAQQSTSPEIPPPPGIDDPGVTTQTDTSPAEAGTPATVSEDPLAPLPKPDARLVRDKASRDAAAEAQRTAESDLVKRQQGNDTVEEYRQNGRVWKIRIVPQQGPVQTFTDVDGSGLRRDPREGPVSPVYYTLYEWK
jgi:hypothetical protein